MEHLADEFIRRRRSLPAGRGTRYQGPLRQLAVDFAAEAKAAGWSANRIARRLGVSWATLERWCEAPPEAALGGGMREVVVREAAPSSIELGAVLVTPEGYRIEGLEREDLVGLLQALRR